MSDRSEPTDSKPNQREHEKLREMTTEARVAAAYKSGIHDGLMMAHAALEGSGGDASARSHPEPVDPKARDGSQDEPDEHVSPTEPQNDPYRRERVPTAGAALEVLRTTGEWMTVTDLMRALRAIGIDALRPTVTSACIRYQKRGLLEVRRGRFRIKPEAKEL